MKWNKMEKLDTWQKSKSCLQDTDCVCVWAWREACVDQECDRRLVPRGHVFWACEKSRPWPRPRPVPGRSAQTQREKHPRERRAFKVEWLLSRARSGRISTACFSSKHVTGCIIMRINHVCFLTSTCCAEQDHAMPQQPQVVWERLSSVCFL